ncbi:hypothetical protein Y88_1543 [Novosphingobium nitrogenifigens DSM 19370]|uniref:ATP-grasp domain-containing protein n=1 Tax=Novosphingobium nitrogenifigens DSM 19370 TaxID=983920 RepID=F1Z7J7_9SPHN|nr:hypothetical protein [Novosphingobium nitrogenifigens]EGD59388.1 hypothetical protein Y88_1543 [Novosphingobium nitrogenifigens DSM 19370]
MTILLFAIEPGRSGPARLPQNLMTAGLGVTIVCPTDNPLYHTASCDHRVALPHTKSGWRMARILDKAVRTTRTRMIIPADEQALALLRAVLDGPYARGVGERTRHVLTQSLAAPEALDKLIFKSHTMALARTLGIAVPDGRTVETLEDARAFAAAAGYPVFLKHSFSWAGAGVVKCADEAELAAALAAMQTGESRLKATLRRLLGRDWYPAQAPIDIQSPIAGRPAMYCALAWKGRLIAGFAGTPLAVSSETGPSTCVEVGAHVLMEAMSRKMIEATGATGLIGFDFMLAKADGMPHMLECNARPIQISHLGYRIGVDIAADLRAVLGGKPLPSSPRSATCSLDVCLFPYALAADRVPRHLFCDIPGADPALMAFGRAMLAMIEARHKAEATSLIGDTLAATGIQPIAA